MSITVTHHGDKSYHYVYQTKNLINGKTYIGVHSTNNLTDGYLGSGDRILQSIKKYGVSNFHIEILSFYNTRREAFEEESFLVDKKWVESRDNYNTTLGGFKPPSWSGKIISKETIEKRKISRQKYVVTSETRKKISEAGKGRIKSEETLTKMSVSMKGKNRYKKSPEHIAKLILAGKNRAPASKETNLKISLALKGRKKTAEEIRKQVEKAKGRKASPEAIASMIAGHKNQTKEQKLKRYRDRSIELEVFKDENSIGIFNSVSEASRVLGYSTGRIGCAARGGTNTTGYVFKIIKDATAT